MDSIGYRNWTEGSDYAKPYICDICGGIGITIVYVDVILAYAIGIILNGTLHWLHNTLCFALALNALNFIIDSA